MSTLWLPLLIGALLSLVLFYFGILYSKSGDLTFSFIFFPYTSALGFVLPDKSGDVGVALGYSLFFLQYPLYSIILGVAYGRGKLASWLLLLLGSHVLLSLVCFVVYRRKRLNRKL
jgi:hypothetical protein